MLIDKVDFKRKVRMRRRPLMASENPLGTDIRFHKYSTVRNTNKHA